MHTRRTKIVCTIGPASQSDSVLRDMINAGMDVARLNCSHADRDELRALYDMVRRASAEMGRAISIMVDLQGPKIRTGPLAAGEVRLEPGSSLRITTKNVPGDAMEVSTTYAGLPQDVKPGDRLLLADGAMELRALDSDGTSVTCEVVVGGTLGEHKGINLPGVAVSAPALTEKDRADLKLAVELGADWVALSFVRSANDIRIIRDALAALDGDIPVVAKLEKPEAMEHLSEIIELANAVMVARGDLGVELPPEQVPLLQKRIIHEANHRAIPVITATQMLESMIHSPRPTRAEASDVANAVFDGSDAIMLSGETSVGEYPVQAVAMMERIALEAEASILSRRAFIHATAAAHGEYPNAIAHAACQLAADLHAKGIVALTRSGHTAMLVSVYRPNVPIVAMTPSSRTYGRAALYWGVTPFLCEDFLHGDDMVEIVSAAAQKAGGVEPGGTVVVVSGRQVLDTSATHALRLQRV